MTKTSGLLVLILMAAMAAPAPAKQVGAATTTKPVPAPASMPNRPAPVSTPAAPVPPTPGTPAPRVKRPVPMQLPMVYLRREPREIDRKISASPKGSISIVNPAGSLHVTGWDRNEVRVTGTLGGGIKKMIFTRDGEEVNIHVVPRDTHPLGDTSDLEISVPAASRLDIRTFSAGIEVVGVRGTLDMESMDGAMDVSGSPRLIHAECVSCDIEIGAQAEVIQAGSVNGSVAVRDAKGSVTLTTVSGSLEMESDKVDEASMTAVSGDISFRGHPSRNGSMSFQTHSGGIELYLSSSLSADFQITNFTGEIETAFGKPAVQKTDSRIGNRPREMSFSTGSGGARLKIESFSGAIAIHKI